MSVRILVGDALARLRELPAESVQCVVTSPPYWGLRDYGNGGGGIGLEGTLTEHIDALVAVFREVRRVLRGDGVCWLNYGDAYNAGTSARRKPSRGNDVGGWQAAGSMGDERVNAPGMKPKDLLMLPARVALALQADGWWLRSEIVWHKPNPMPESATDRPTNSHEKVFLLTKAARYFYDADAVRAGDTGHGPSTLQRDMAPRSRSRPGVRMKAEARIPALTDRSAQWFRLPTSGTSGRSPRRATGRRTSRPSRRRWCGRAWRRGRVSAGPARSAAHRGRGW